MTRLLFIGNSHLAAVKTAWEAGAGPPAEFFGAPQRAWVRMSLLPGNSFGLSTDGDHQRQRKVVEQANGKTTVSLDGRDVICLVGSFSAAVPLATLLAGCDVAGLRETGAPTLLSGYFLTRACAALAEQALPPQGWWNRKDARGGGGGGGGGLLPRPAPCETCLVSTHAEFQPWRPIAANTVGLAQARALLDTALTTAFAARGLTYLPQPAHTLTEAGLTQGQYLAEGGGAPQGQEHKRGDHAQ